MSNSLVLLTDARDDTIAEVAPRGSIFRAVERVRHAPNLYRTGHACLVSVKVGHAEALIKVANPHEDANISTQITTFCYDSDGHRAYDGQQQRVDLYRGRWRQRYQAFILIWGAGALSGFYSHSFC